MLNLTDLLPTGQINVKSCIQINTVKLADPGFNTLMANDKNLMDFICETQFSDEHI